MEELNYVCSGKYRPNYLDIDWGNFDNKYVFDGDFHKIDCVWWLFPLLLVVYTQDSDEFNLSEDWSQNWN